MRENRKRFSRLAIQSPEKAAEQLHSMADGLANCKNTSDIIFALTEIFDVSERTIFRDLV